jgi:hypothetical protein
VALLGLLSSEHTKVLATQTPDNELLHLKHLVMGSAIVRWGGSTPHDRTIDTRSKLPVSAVNCWTTLLSPGHSKRSVPSLCRGSGPGLPGAHRSLHHRVVKDRLSTSPSPLSGVRRTPVHRGPIGVVVPDSPSGRVVSSLTIVPQTGVGVKRTFRFFRLFTSFSFSYRSFIHLEIVYQRKGVVSIELAFSSKS